MGARRTPGLGPLSSRGGPTQMWGLGVSAGQAAAARLAQAGPGWSSPLTRAPRSGCRPRPGAGLGRGGCWDHRGPGDRRGREGGPPARGQAACLMALTFVGFGVRVGAPCLYALGGSGPWEAPRCGLRTLSQDLGSAAAPTPPPPRCMAVGPRPLPRAGPASGSLEVPLSFSLPSLRAEALGRLALGGAPPTWPSMCLPSRRLWWLPERG